jgi:predicted ATPase
MLMRRWERARQGNGQLVLIVGEPGLGKSRLIEEFHSQLPERPHTWVEGVAHSFRRTRHLHPIAEWGHQLAQGGDSPASSKDTSIAETSGSGRPRQHRIRHQERVAGEVEHGSSPAESRHTRNSYRLMSRIDHRPLLA